ncbi:MAG TPA: class I SAM-dependent methyltransferase [Steroidobacteraceae bacterium]|nr:class I SAM-dependent methyltransferase [Steroidobacteraceae bacterium]
MGWAAPAATGARALRDANRSFYDSLWSTARLIEPQRLNTWPLVRSLLTDAQRRLEVAPGLRPRLPLEGSEFAELSAPAVAELARRGARVVRGEITSLPFESAIFDLVVALDIIEHVEDDASALAELCRVVVPQGLLLLSVPLHAARWTRFDELVGHRRRYDPEALAELLGGHSLRVRQSAAYGMQPRSSRLTDCGMWCLARHPRIAMWWYNRIFMPLGVYFQPPLALGAGMIDTRGVDEIILVCQAAH